MLKAPISLDALPGDTPPAIRELIGRCLERNVKKRPRDNGEARITLERLIANPEKAVVRPQWNKWWIPALAATCAAALLGWGLRPVSPVASGERMSFEVNPPSGGKYAAVSNNGGSTISPDGRWLAYVSADGNRETALYVRRVGSAENKALPGTRDAGKPFWSPDSKSLVFVANGKLQRIDVAGGIPVLLRDTPRARGGSWNDDGIILFSNRSVGIQQIPATGGAPQNVTRIDKDAGGYHYYPQFLPGGERFLYLNRHADPSKSGIWVTSLDGSPPVEILRTSYRAHYDSVSGHLLYLVGKGTLMARRLELDPPRLTGEALLVTEGVTFAEVNGYANFSVSATGSLFYTRGDGARGFRLHWRDREGKILRTMGDWMDAVDDYALSPRNDRLAFTAITNGTQEIWMMDTATGLKTRLTFSGARAPRWSPDGKFVYFSWRKGVTRKAADGTGDEEVISKDSLMSEVQSVSGDGKYLLYGLDDVMMLPLAEGSSPRPYLQSNFSKARAAFSPDSRWVAYSSSESGPVQIYVEGFPDRRGKWQISSAGGDHARWRADGKELYWRGSDGAVMAAALELRPDGITAGRPEPLFTAPGGRFDVSRDGREFLLWEEPVDPASDMQMMLELNWVAGLGGKPQ